MRIIRKHKRKIQIATASLIAATAVLTAPIIPQDMKWIISYQTISFDSSDGDLPKDGYAVRSDGFGYYAWIDKNSLRNFDSVPVNYDLTGLKEYHVVGDAYYDEFMGADNRILRVRADQQKYQRLAKVRDEPQPNRKEMVNFLSPKGADAAIAADAVSSSRNSTGVSLSFSHTTTGSNTLMSVGTSAQDANHANYPITGITYNSVALTKIRSDEPVGNVRSEMWYLINPSTGANTVTITNTGAIGELTGTVFTMTGAKQSAQPDSNIGASGTSAAPVSGQMTTIADDTFITSVITSESTIQDSTVLDAKSSLTDQAFENAKGSSGYFGKAGLFNMGHSLTSSQAYAISVAAYAPAADDATTHNTVFQVDQSLDDAEETNSTTVVVANNSDLELVDDVGALQTVGIRFSDVYIHTVATVASSSLVFQTDEVQTGADTVTIKGELAADSAIFVATNANISRRTPTSASVSWTPNATSCSTVESTCTSPDISTIVQEIYNQGGWTSGNAITFIITGSSAFRRTMESWDGENGAAPVLKIKYTTSAVAGDHASGGKVQIRSGSVWIRSGRFIVR